jgi:hypothetical protein
MINTINTFTLYSAEHTLVTLPNGDLLAIGGVSEDENKLRSVERYSNKVWTHVESLPFTGWQGAAVVVDDSVVYCAGDMVNKCAVFNVSVQM